MTLAGLSWARLETYLISVKRQSPSSVKNHKSRFFAFCSWFGDKEFTRDNFASFLQDASVKGLSASYQDNCLTLGKHIAVLLGCKDELEEFKYSSEGYSEPEYICSRRDIEKITSVSVPYKRFKDRKIKHPALIWFLWQVGSRIDETLQLEWRDIIIAPLPMIHFRKETTKTKRERYCPIPKDLLAMINRLPRTNSNIFSLIDAANFRKDLATRCEKAKVPYKVTPHTLRDSSINNKLEYGMPFEQVSLYHGHSKIDTTYRFYTRIKAMQMATALYQFDPAFSSDLTYEQFVDNAEKEIRKRANTKIVTIAKKEMVVDNKRQIWIGYLEN